MRRDIVSAYVVTLVRVLAWIVVTAAVFRVAGKPAFGLLAIVQSTAGILEYAAIGLSPAIIRLTAEAIQHARENSKSSAEEAAERSEAILNVYANGFAMALLTAVGGLLLVLIFGLLFHSSRTNRETNGAALELISMVGIATLLRMMSDAPGAALQTSGKIFLDNLLLTIHEIVWGAGTIFDLFVLHLPWQRATGFALVAGSIILLIVRGIFSHQYGSGLFDHWWRRYDGKLVRRLLIFGGMVVAAQMADYLYSPTNNLLIWNLIDRDTVAVYAPAVQVDGAALLLVGALASVLLPRTALAHASGNSHAVRTYYIRGTLWTFGALAVAAPIVWLAAPHFFKLWLGNPMQPTCSILSIMLIHTVIGGSSAVGRSILLAIGKVREFTISVLIAGVANVVLSYCFVKYGHLKLPGIVLGTILAVTGRCAIWLPWYTLRTLRVEPTEIEPPLAIPTPPPPIP